MNIIDILETIGRFIVVLGLVLLSIVLVYSLIDYFIEMFRGMKSVLYKSSQDRLRLYKSVFKDATSINSKTKQSKVERLILKYQNLSGMYTSAWDVFSSAEREFIPLNQRAEVFYLDRKINRFSIIDKISSDFLFTALSEYNKYLEVYKDNSFEKSILTSLYLRVKSFTITFKKENQNVFLESLLNERIRDFFQTLYCYETGKEFISSWKRGSDL